VLGLVLLGSAARPERRDEWSDHDFFLITVPGAQEDFRNAFWWLADETDIADSVRETTHGVQVVLANGHLLEFAVFDPDEIGLARVNDYVVLVDKSDIGQRLERCAAATREYSHHSDVAVELRLFAVRVLVAGGRFRRGEHIAARMMLTNYALPHLLRALIQGADAASADSIDVTRRFEEVLPTAAQHIDEAYACPDFTDTCLALLAIAEECLGGRSDFPGVLCSTVRRRLSVDVAPDGGS